MIKTAEIVLYNENDDSIGFELSPKQLEAIVKILGLNIKNNELQCYSDESLQTIIDKTINKLKPQEGKI